MTDTETAPQGFGYDPIDISPYFILTIPREEEGSICLYRCADRPRSSAVATSISPEFALKEARSTDSTATDKMDAVETDCLEEVDIEAEEAPVPHAQTPVSHWNLIETRLRTYFNQRLRKVQLPTGFWRYGENPLADHFGRELALLLWALSAAPESETLLIYTNWRRLLPEERRWLYARVANASRSVAKPDPESEDVDDVEVGWLRAVQIALREPLPTEPTNHSSAHHSSAHHSSAEHGTESSTLPIEKESNIIRRRKLQEREGQLRLL